MINYYSNLHSQWCIISGFSSRAGGMVSLSPGWRLRLYVLCKWKEKGKLRDIIVFCGVHISTYTHIAAKTGNLLKRTDRWSISLTVNQVDRHIYRRTDRQINKQTDRQTNKMTDRRADRKTDIYTDR